jgi:hypothetical protein
MYFYLVYFTSFEYRGPAEFQDTLDLPDFTLWLRQFNSAIANKATSAAVTRS